MENDELVPLGFKLPKSNSEKIKNFAKNRRVKISVILNEAVMEYIERRENPTKQIDMIHSILCDHPELLDEPLKRFAARNISTPRE